MCADSCSRTTRTRRAPGGNTLTWLVATALAGDRRALARVISIVEDDRRDAEAMLADAHRSAGGTYRVGITGAPGAGKSTLTDGLITRLRTAGEAVAVLAVDPTSPFTGGAVLGDRVRMQEHASDDGVYIRSMASRGHLGGLSAAAPKALAWARGVAGAPLQPSGVQKVLRGSSAAPRGTGTSSATGSAGSIAAAGAASPRPIAMAAQAIATTAQRSRAWLRNVSILKRIPRCPSEARGPRSC